MDNKNLLNVKDEDFNDERQQIRVVQSEYVSGLNSTLKNTNNLNNNLVRYDQQSTVINKNNNNNNYSYNNHNNNNDYEEFKDVSNPLDDVAHPGQESYHAPPQNPMMQNPNNPLANNNNAQNYNQTNLFGNYSNQYSQPPQQNYGYNGAPNQGFQGQNQNNYQYQAPPAQFNSPYQQPPQQFNVSYPGQNNMTQDQAMYRSQNSNGEGFQISEDQKKYLIIGAIVCIILILFIF